MWLVKYVVGLFPEKTRKHMRQQLWLFNLYSRSLQKSGLFYGFPSPLKLQKLYCKAIVKQAIEMADICENKFADEKLSTLVTLSGQVDADRNTLSSLITNSAVSAIYLQGQSADVSRLLEEFSHSSTKELGALDDLIKSENRDGLFVLRGGDILHCAATKVFAFYAKRNDDKRIFYCDIDSIDCKGERHLAEFFPAWNPDLQLTTGYIRTGVLIQKSTDIHNFLHFVIDNQDASALALWLADYYLREVKLSIEHIPLCLVHQTFKYSLQWDRELRKLNNEQFIVTKAEVIGLAKVEWYKETQPLVSLVIPTKNAKNLVQMCISSILSKTSYQNFEILLIDNNSDDPEALAYFDKLVDSEDKVRLLRYPHEFNYSAINNFAVAHAKGEIVGLINNDIEVISANWLTDMVGHTLRADIGCVGAKLLYPDMRIQHAGVVMGYGGGAGHAHKYFPRYHPGYLNRLAVTNNFSAVTAACLLVKKSDFDAVGGLNQDDLTVAFNDVDFCLRIRELGRQNLYCAEAELFHHESISRGADDTLEKRQRFENELDYLQRKWPELIKNDPAYNPNLTLRFENFSIRE
ncbi:glycosyl transferase, family 2 [Paraglaciecola sp. T6c]|nr:glycosyl transferase, family 2 [Paraglaciecola sp. T6c]